MDSEVFREALQALIDDPRHPRRGEYIRILVREDPKAGLAHLIASTYSQNTGCMEDSWKHLAVGLAVDPNNYALHRHLAGLLTCSGDAELADCVLEAGWEIVKKTLPRRDVRAAWESWHPVDTNVESVARESQDQ